MKIGVLKFLICKSENRDLKNMDLEKIIDLAKMLSKPWQIATYSLSVLLVISLLGNIFLATQEVEVILEADNNIDSDIVQTQG